MKRSLFTILSALSLLLAVATLALSRWSFRVYTAPIDPTTGAAAAGPPHPHVFLPLPSDANEYWVPLNGSLQRWEYTPWDKRWYRVNGFDVPLWIPAIILLVFPAVVWMFGARRRDVVQA